MQKIRNTDVKKILKKTSLDLRRLEYEANMCCSKGEKKTVHLKVTNREELNKYKTSMIKQKTVNGISFTTNFEPEYETKGLEHGPWSELRIVFGTPVHAVVDAEHRIGPI